MTVLDEPVDKACLPAVGGPSLIPTDNQSLIHACRGCIKSTKEKNLAEDAKKRKGCISLSIPILIQFLFADTLRRSVRKITFDTPPNLIDVTKPVQLQTLIEGKTYHGPELTDLNSCNGQYFVWSFNSLIMLQKPSDRWLRSDGCGL